MDKPCAALISRLTQKMIAYSNGNIHDINHFLKVYAYAKTIGECEGLDAQTQAILEIAAVIHDIACPLCRIKYGNANGKNQEIESPALVREFLQDSGLSDTAISRIAYLVGHHHTPDAADGPDYQILIEADYLVNADEGGHSKEKIQNTMQHIFKTQSGTILLRSVYQLP